MALQQSVVSGGFAVVSLGLMVVVGDEVPQDLAIAATLNAAGGLTGNVFKAKFPGPIQILGGPPGYSARRGIHRRPPKPL